MSFSTFQTCAPKTQAKRSQEGSYEGLNTTTLRDSTEKNIIKIKELH